MRKSAMLLSLLFATLISVAGINPVQADIEEWTWLPAYTYRGYEPMYYQDYIVGYESGATANLAIPVINDNYSLMIVSSVWISFDWGENKTLDLRTSPIQISKGNRYAFTISFIVPSRSIASGEFAHTYRVFIKFNATGGLVDEIWSYDWNYSSPSYKFAVFSRDQTKVTELWSRFNIYPSSPPAWMTSPEANELWYEAQSIAMNASRHHTSGDFANARTELEAALSKIEAAFAAEVNFTLDEQEAARTRTETAMVTANATQIGVYGFLVGWILIGVGFIIYGLRKPKLVRTH